MMATTRLSRTCRSSLSRCRSRTRRSGSGARVRPRCAGPEALGDAWYPIGSNPRFRVGTIEQLTGYMSRVRNYARDAGRDPAEIDFAYSAGWYNDREAQTGPDGSRQVFTGTPEQIAGDVRAFEELGVRHLMVGLAGGQRGRVAGPHGPIRGRGAAAGVGHFAPSRFGRLRAGSQSSPIEGEEDNRETRPYRTPSNH